MDLTASILAATNAVVPVDAGLEGINLIPILAGQAETIERTLFWRVNVPTRQQRAVRSGDWKLLNDAGALLLYDLAADIGERNDLAGSRSDIVAKFRPLISAWEKDVDAEAGSK
jgi:arylsulfatase A-like enzyme